MPSFVRCRLAALSLVMALTACGGGSTQPAPPPPPPPPPAPVASVAVTPPTANLVVPQTTTLTTTLRDAGGGTLTGRTVTWTSASGAVATVSNTGVVTAVGPGTTLVTATAEGQSGTAQVTVAEGMQIGIAGGTVVAHGGDLRLTIPAGALPTPTTITVTRLSAPATAPPEQWQVAGPVYQLGPDGTTFAQPVTVTLKYDNATLPDWTMTGDLGLLRLAGTQWHQLTDIVVDVAAGTVSGKTMGCSTVGVGALDPDVTLSPASGSVNIAHRHVIFDVVVAPRGNAVPLPATTGSLLYRWRTSGQNGALSAPAPTQWTSTTQAQYTATGAVLDQQSGHLDNVWVDVLLNPETLTDPTAGPQRIVTVQAAVDADLQLTYDISPSTDEIGAGATANLQFLARNKQGQPVTIATELLATWETSGAHGTLVAGSGSPATTAVYTANTTFSTAPPRVDDVTVVLTKENTHFVRLHSTFAGASLNQQAEVVTVTEQGRAKGFVTVKVNYTVKVSPAKDTVAAGGTALFDVTLEPAYDGPGLAYRSTNSGNFGTLSVGNGILENTTLVSYDANEWGGGADVITVEVVAVVGTTVLESLGTGQATVEVDPWRQASFSVATLPTAGGAFVAAQVSVPKLPGASQYELKVVNGATQYAKTWSAATTTNPHTVMEVLDGGTAWLINLEAGFATTPGGISGRQNLYATMFANINAQFRASP